MAHCKQNSRRLLSSFSPVHSSHLCMVFLYHRCMNVYLEPTGILNWFNLPLVCFWLDIRYQNPILFVLFCLLIFVVIAGILQLFSQVYGWWMMFCCLSQVLRASWLLLLQIYFSYNLSLRIFSYVLCVLFTF